MKTKHRPYAAVLLTAGALSASPNAQAIEYNQFLPEKSSVTFSYQQMGVKMDGRFRKFAAQLAFDPAKAAVAKASFEVDLAGIDTGASESDQEVAGKAWFNTTPFPVARFVASTIKPLGGNRYEVSGQLSIKGKTQALIFPATLNSQGKSAQFEGAFTLRRADFSIGEGSWAKFDIVANDVLVKFSIAATGK